MKHILNLPPYRDYHFKKVKIIEERLKTLELDRKYQGFTLNEELEIVKCECSIANNGSYNYHNNYDDSENVMKVEGVQKWWTLKEDEIKAIQKEHIDCALTLLNEEIDRLKSIYPKIKQVFKPFKLPENLLT